MPAAPKADTSLSTWDQMVADAHSMVEEIGPFQLPLGDITIDGKTEKNVTVDIPCPDGVNYLLIVQAQRAGNVPLLLDSLIPDHEDRQRVISKMTGVPWPIVDVLAGKVLRHYYGLSIEVEEKSGNSPSS